MVNDLLNSFLRLSRDALLELTHSCYKIKDAAEEGEKLVACA